MKFSQVIFIIEYLRVNTNVLFQSPVMNITHVQSTLINTSSEDTRRRLIGGNSQVPNCPMRVSISVVGLETGLGLETGFAGLGSRSRSRSRYPEVSVLVSVSEPSGLEYLAGLTSRPAFFTIMQLIREHPNLPPLPAQYDFASSRTEHTLRSMHIK